MAKSRKQPVPPEQSRLRRQVAQLLASKRYDLAEGVVRQMLAADPNDAFALRNLSICMFRFRRYDEAMESARAAVSIDPTPLNLCQLAAIHLAKVELDPALDLFQRAVALKADHIPSLGGLVGTYVLKKQFEQALQWAEKGLAIKADHGGMLRNRAKALAALKRESEAIAAMEHFLRIDPDSPESHATASDILKRFGKTEEASEFARRAMQMNPADPSLHNSLAQLKLKERKFDDAQRHFESAAETYDSRQDGQKGSKWIEIQSLMGQAAVNLNKRQFRFAEAQYARVIELDPDSAVARGLIAGAIGAQKRFDEVLILARAAVEQHPKSLICKVVLAELLANTEQFDESMEVARSALELKPDSQLPHLLMAEIYLEMKEFAEASAAAEKARAISPTPSNHRALAVSLAGMGNRERAIEEIDRVLQKEPDTFNTHAASGFAYYLLGEFEKAELHFLRATELDATGTGCDGMLGVVYHAQGKIDQAIPLLERSHARNPYQRRVREALQAIQEAAKQKIV